MELVPVVPLESYPLFCSQVEEMVEGSAAWRWLPRQLGLPKLWYRYAVAQVNIIGRLGIRRKPNGDMNDNI